MSSGQEKRSKLKSIDLAKEIRACELTDNWLENYNFCLKEKK